MNSRQLQYAVLLAETRNFSQVAEHLNITQPALSKQIINLENELGVKLFDRTTTPLSLTAAGEFFIQKAEELLFEEDLLIKTMSRYKIGDHGRLTIGISPFRSLYLMPDIIKKFKEKYPNIQIVLSEQGRSQLHKGISEGLYDFAITNLPVDESRLNITPLEPDTLVLSVPHFLTDKINDINKKDKKIRLSQCSDLPFVVLSQGQEMRQLFDKLCTISHITPHISLEVIGVSTAWAMVRSGIAATILPKQFAQYDLNDNSIVLFELDQDTYVRQPAIITRRGQFISEYAQYAIDLLTNKI